MIKLNQEDKRYIIDTTRKVFVYKNLHKDCWSVKQDGLVKAHTTDIELWDCAFRVNKAGRERVLKEKRKKVHAGISGYIDHLGMTTIPRALKEIDDKYIAGHFGKFGMYSNKTLLGLMSPTFKLDTSHTSYAAL